MSREKLRVAVFDDEQNRRQSWINALNECKSFTDRCKTVELEPDKLQSIYGALQFQRTNSRERESHALSTERQEALEVLNRLDILFIDFDIPYSEDLKVGSGEEIAYLARCYSSCGIIVGINYRRSPGSGFDLTLNGNFESYADLNVGDDDLANPGLWTGDPEKWKSFRPWSWPVLPDAVDRYQQQIKAVNLDAAIFETLGVPEEVVGALSVEDLELLTETYKREDVGELTFRDFVEHSGNGLVGKDRTSDKFAVRIAAARISKWLETRLLVPLEILVDAPHLALRAPGLLDGDLQVKDTWTKTTNLSGLRGLKVDEWSGFQLKKEFWVSRPVWFWPQLRWQDLPVHKMPELVFCEDTSRFSELEFAEVFFAHGAERFVLRENLEDTRKTYYPKSALL